MSVFFGIYGLIRRCSSDGWRALLGVILLWCFGWCIMQAMMVVLYNTLYSYASQYDACACMWLHGRWLVHHVDESTRSVPHTTHLPSAFSRR